MDLQSLPQHMLSIPSGTITLRDDRKKTQWQEQIKPFKLAQFPVTQKLYEQVMGINPSLFIGALHPVDSVSWLDAIKFCNALSERSGLLPVYQIGSNSEHQGDSPASTLLESTLKGVPLQHQQRILAHERQIESTQVTQLPQANGYRLPTDAEWEHACRAGSNASRYGDLNDVAWFADNSGDSSQPVGQKQPNEFGLHDMLGNVWEWCWDVYDADEYKSYRIFRGGGWADEARSVLATNRRRSHPSYAIDDLGFRVAQNAPKQL